MKRYTLSNIRFAIVLLLLGAAGVSCQACQRTDPPVRTSYEGADASGVTLSGVTSGPSTIGTPSAGITLAKREEIATLLSLLNDARTGGKTVPFVPPSPTEGETARTFFASFFRTGAGTSDLFSVSSPLPGIYVAREELSKKRGAGVYVARGASARKKVVIEIPHSFFDEGTLPIGAELFFTLGADAMLVNTVHRYRSRATDGTGEDPVKPEDVVASDVAHGESSFFLEAHRVLAKDTLTLQIHGFRDDAARGVDAILSAAGSQHSVTALKAALEKRLGSDRIRAYPEDIRTLGGTANLQARVSIEQRSPFLHIELSRTFRNELLSSEARRIQWLSAFVDAGL